MHVLSVIIGNIKECLSSSSYVHSRNLTPETKEQVSSLINSLLEVCPEAVSFEYTISLFDYLRLLSIFPLHSIYHVPSSGVDDVFLTVCFY